MKIDPTEKEELDEYFMRTARQQAVIAAQRFVEEEKDTLSIFTLRKAFELGFYKGYIFDGE